MPLGLKERLYADAGVVVLGTAGDDGLHIVPREHLSLSPEAVAVTLGRLLALLRAWPIDLTAVVAVDRASLPLATVLAERLSLPRRPLSQLAPDDRALLVLLAGRQAELLQVVLEQSPPGTLSFVFALGWYEQHDLLPDIIGVPVRDIAEAAAALEGSGDEPDATEELRSACQSAAPEGNVEAQVRYYTQEHPRLRFLEALMAAAGCRPPTHSARPDGTAGEETSGCTGRIE